MTKKIIRGAFDLTFGLFDRPRQPVRVKDTLNSKQFATIQDLISEGEIEGFATPSKAGIAKETEAYTNASLKDVFLNEQPVLRPDADNANPEASKFNFQNVEFFSRFGTSNQPHIPGLEKTSAQLPNFSPALCTKANNGVVRSLSTGKDAVKVTISFDQIQHLTDEGDVFGLKVKLKISLEQTLSNGSSTGFQEKINDTIKGRTGDAYSKEYLIALQSDYTSAQIKVERITNDRTGESKQDEFSVSLIEEIIDEKQTYPDSAYSQIRIDSEQFNTIPSRAYRVRGVKVRVPAESSASVSAQYTQSNLIVTVNSSNHALKEGDTIVFDATNSGTSAPDGTYQVQGEDSTVGTSAPTQDTFDIVVTGSSQTISSQQSCTYKLKPHVDLQTGRVNYPEGYIFNGTLGSAQWCSCPALILLDLLTTERYGFGTHIKDSNLDIFSFITASKYANELVDDFQGGKEARFSCNVNIQGAKEAYTLINELAGVMRCFPIWTEGSVSIVQDSPTDSSYLFSLANVTEAGFSYTGSSLRQRHSIIAVSYYNMDSRQIDVEIVGDDVVAPNKLQEDIDRQLRLGIVKKDIKAFACTSRGQARRLGRAVLLSEEQETEVVNFSTSIEAGAVVRPGAVISINDPVKQGQRRSGRIKSVVNSAQDGVGIIVDNTEGLNSFIQNNAKCSVILPNGTIETKDVTSIIGSAITLDPNSLFSITPNANSIWLLQSDGDGETPQTFRVINVEEQDGINFAISAISYRNDKYQAIDSTGGISLPPRNISSLNQEKDPPSNLSIIEKIVVRNNVAIPVLFVSWASVTGVNQYQVQYRFNDSNWNYEVVIKPEFELSNTQAGTYEFKVFSYNSSLTLSATSSDDTFVAEGKTAPPEDVQELTIEPVNSDSVRLRWKQSVSVDVLHGGLVYIRHSNKTDGSGTFQDSTDLIEAVPGNSTEVICPSLEGEYILKFRDDSNNFSQGETSIILDLPDLIDNKQILSDTQHPTFSGTKTNVSTVGSGLQLSNPSANLSGTYDFTNTLDLGGVFSLSLKRLIQSIGFTVGNVTTIDELIPAGTFWDDYAKNGSFDGEKINDVNAFLSVRTTQNDPSGSPTYTQFNKFANGKFKGRGFQFRLNLESESIAHNISVAQLSVISSFESRVERSYKSSGTISTVPLTSSSSSSGLDVEFANKFFVGTSSLGGANSFLPSIGVTIIGAEAGDYFVLSNITGSGFNIKILDSSNNPVNPAKQFTFQAVGYGKGV